MKKLIFLLLVLAVLSGMVTANLGERRVYPLRPGIKYLFTNSRDPNNWWDDVNDVYTIEGLLAIIDVNLTGDLDVNDVNIVGDLDLHGTLTLHGEGRKLGHVVIGAATWKKGATAPTASYENIFPTLIFGDGNEDDAHYSTYVPYQWDNTTNMEVYVHWQHDDDAKTGKVLWKLDYIGVKEGEDPAGAGATLSQLSAGGHPQDELIETVFSTKILAANLERDDDLGLRIWRDGDDGADDLTEGAELITLHIHYVKNRLGGEAMFEYYLLLETGDFILLETGDKIILENI